MQAQLWVLNLLHRVPKPIAEDDTYKLRMVSERGIRHGVDHETYAYQLALDIGSAPSVAQVINFGPTVFGTWALGVNFNTKFRLVGPWRDAAAAEIMQTELWNVIKRRQNWFSECFPPSVVQTGS